MPALDGAAASLILWGFALVGLGLAACGALLGLTGRRRARAALERLAQIEEAGRSAREREARRARLSAFIEAEIEVRWYLTIRNEGHGAAEDFTVSIDGRPLEHSPMIDPAALEPNRPGAVAAHGSVRIPLRTAERPEQLQLELSWTDGSGELGLYQAELSR